MVDTVAKEIYEIITNTLPTLPIGGVNGLRQRFSYSFVLPKIGP